MNTKSKIFSKNMFKYLFEFIVVFAGVFVAFMLTEYKDKKDEVKKKRELYIAIYEDLNSFYESGKKENKNGFVNIFFSNDVSFDSAIAAKKLPASVYLYADSWYVPIVNSLSNNGLLKDIDVDIYKRVAKFNSAHQNFIQKINYFNNFYDKNVTANYDTNIEFMYLKGENKLRPKYAYLESSMTDLGKMAEVLVEFAHSISTEIKEKHIDTK